MIGINMLSFKQYFEESSQNAIEKLRRRRIAKAEMLKQKHRPPIQTPPEIEDKTKATKDLHTRLSKPISSSSGDSPAPVSSASSIPISHKPLSKKYNKYEPSLLRKILGPKARLSQTSGDIVSKAANFARKISPTIKF